ncbi:hypothetical protein N7495_002392 [Penicillium taxi]|uniref:uncharacterized protein n=1 Tax=Penicillium taxi TaxID=168475 RepID=UPI0025453C9A|nr:uncharacterized protein N7495_002392 [Penicillium taxi]KAJ5901864.1 hypothetical protein N7495_002392 [Penicillium taxi]
MVHGHTHHPHENILPRVIVYETLEPDFVGEVGGYVTRAENDIASVVDSITKDDPTTTTKQTKTTEETTTTKKTTAEKTETTSVQKEATTTTKTKVDTTHTTEGKTAGTTTNQTTSVASETTSTPTSFATSISTNSTQDLLTTSTASASDLKASASPTAVSLHSTGMSSGAKAGTAIGVILGIGLLAALIFFFYRRNKKQNEADELLDEKNVSTKNLPARPTVAPTHAAAPQLNVRPVTQFAPDLSNTATGAVEDAAAGAVTGGAVVTMRNLTGDGTPPPTPPKSISPDPFSDPENPFRNATPSVNSQNVPVSPTDTGSSVPVAAEATAADAGTLAAVGKAASISSETAQEQPRPSTAESAILQPGSLSVAGSVDGDSVSSAAMAAGTIGTTGVAMAAVAAAGADAGSQGAAPSNVHRVQMDFVPTQPDELQLRTGSLVRMLHEYDDGWALCLRLDRSQQGVAPRSCLSARPIKPRSRPPPEAGPGPGPRGRPMMVGPNGRPMSPAGRGPGGPPGGRFYPQDGRSGSPGPGTSTGSGYAGPAPLRNSPGRSMSPVHQFPIPRSMSPGGGRPGSPSMSPRSMSPGPGMRQGQRSMSPGPYGPPGMRRPTMPAAQRARSNSAGNVPPRSAPVHPSPLAAGPPVPAPTADLPSLPDSTSDSPNESNVSKKPVPGQSS